MGSVFFWCIAHRLELALKDSLKNKYVATIDEMLMRLYYLNEKSPKNAHSLEEELQMCVEKDDRPQSRGNRPLRACGTRFVFHKVAALGRIIDNLWSVLCSPYSHVIK